MSEFVHLNVHSHYSVLESSADVKQLIKKAIADGQKALAITDSGVMYAGLEQYTTSKFDKDIGQIKPIIGFRANITTGSRFDKSANSSGKRFYHLVLIAKDLTGYKNLIKLSSIGFLEGFYYRPRIDFEVLHQHSEGLIALSGGIGAVGSGGEIESYLRQQDYISAKEAAQRYKDIFGKDFYIELHRLGLPETNELIEEQLKIAREFDIPIVATNNVHYIEKKHSIPHNVLLMIQNYNSSISNEIDVSNLRFQTDEFYFKSQAEMVELFKDLPEAIENTVKIAEQCNVELDLKSNHMPQFPIPQTSKATNLEEYLEELVYEGLSERFETITDEIKKRADYEIEIINKMGFPGYFLIVWDFIKEARKRGVSVGPGRGSAAGSIVAYALEITNVNPLEYDLLFERFLNPERVSMPDIDIDFSDDKREIVINYVKEFYGEEAVSQIITFGKLSSRAVLTDVGRVLNVDLAKIKEITKKIPVKFGKVATIEETIALPELEYLKNIYENYKNKNLDDVNRAKELIATGKLNEDDYKIGQLLDYCLVLEGKVRNTGIHAAGVVIAPGDLTQYVPIMKVNKDKAGGINIATQYSMKYLEMGGLLKMDFLGLKTLSIIEQNLALIKQNYDVDLDIDAISLEDEKTYELFGNGDTLSVFQFESTGMQESLKKLKPHSLEEISAMNALYRPGPMDNIPSFIERKFGREPITYLHDSMRPSLQRTYGIIVYQEQVMRLVQDIAGFSLGEADLLRRAMGKKDTKAMSSLKPRFMEGAKEKNKIDDKLASQIFDLIQKFADYGFNKSHAVAYSYVAFQTAFLKAHYPAEFIAANMTAEINDQTKIVALRENAKKYGLKLMPPDINNSQTYFNAKGDTIYFGLSAIRNVGIPASNNILKARQDGAFKDLFDFAGRVDNHLINKRTLEALICSGAFDSLNIGHRNQLFNSVELVLEYSRKKQEEDELQMDNLFGSINNESTELKLYDAPEWTELERLEKEKEYLNFYVSGHPLLNYETHISSFIKYTISNLHNAPQKTEISLIGMITEVRTRLDKDKKPLAFIEFEDLTGKREIFAPSNIYQKYNDFIKKDKIVLVKGILKAKFGNFAEGDDNTLFNINSVSTVDGIISELATGYRIWLDEENPNTYQHLQQFEEYIEYHGNEFNEGRETSFLQFIIINKTNDTKKSFLSDDIHLKLNEEVTHEIIKIFTERNVRFILKGEIEMI